MQILYGSTDVTKYVLSYKKKADFEEGYILGQIPVYEIDLKLNNRDNTFGNLDQTFTIFEGTDQTGVFKAYEKPEKYTSTISVVLYDNMMNLMPTYNSLLDYNTGTTISAQLDEIASKSGVTIVKSNLPSHILNKVIKWYDNTVSMINYVGWIAEISGMNVRADAEGKIIFEEISTTNDYETQRVGDLEVEEVFTVSRVCFNNGILVLEKGNEINNTLYINSGNPYVDEQSLIDYIYNKYNGLSFTSVSKVNMRGIRGLCLGDLVKYGDITFMVTSLTATEYGGESYPIYEISGRLETKNEEIAINRIDNSVRIRRLQVLYDQNEATLNILAQEVDDAVEKVGELELSVDDISLQVSETSEQVYKFESGSGNIFDNTYQYISKDSESQEVISLTDMPLGINMDFMQGKDICISVQVQVKNGIIGSLDGYVGAEFEVGFSDNSKETYAVRWYAGQSSFQYVLATGSVDFDQRIYAHYKLPDKEITSVSNLKTIINLNAEFAYVSNPKVEFGTYPTGYEFDVPYIRDNVVTLNRDYTLIQQQVNELSLQAVSMTQEITTIKGDVSEVTTRLQSAEIKLQPTNILLAINEQLGADGELHTTKFVLDKDGVHISGGGLDVSNNAGTQVFYADTDGNLVLKGTIYATNGEFSGTITGSTINGTTITGGTINGTTITTDKDISVGTKITIAEASAAEMQNGIYIGEKFMIQVTPLMAAATIESKGEIYVVSRSSAGQTGMSAGVGNLTLFAENMIMVTANVTMTKNLTVQGTKNRLVETKSYGKRLLNAVESAYSVFEDFGIAFTDESGFCEVVIDPVFLETVNTSYEYYIFLTSFNGGQITVYEKGRNSFKVKGTPNTQFDWRICARQRDYEDIRLAIAGGSNEIKK